MLGIGGSEFIVIIIVAILVLGPEHLPRIMRTVTKVMSDVRRVSTDFQRAINLEANQEEWRQQNAAASTQKPRRKKKKSASAGESATDGAGIKKKRPKTKPASMPDASLEPSSDGTAAATPAPSEEHSPPASAKETGKHADEPVVKASPEDSAADSSKTEYTAGEDTSQPAMEGDATPEDAFAAQPPLQGGRA